MWLGRMVGTRALAIIQVIIIVSQFLGCSSISELPRTHIPLNLTLLQNSGLVDIARTLQTVTRVVTLLSATPDGIGGLSESRKMQLARGDIPLMIMFIAAASPPAPRDKQRAWSDDEDMMTLMNTCCRCCVQTVSSALEHAIRSELVVRSWYHASAAQQCIQLSHCAAIDDELISASIAVTGACFGSTHRCTISDAIEGSSLSSSSSSASSSSSSSTRTAEGRCPQLPRLHPVRNIQIGMMVFNLGLEFGFGSEFGV